MADKTIAEQLIELIDAKDDITAAINESAVGTTQEIGIIDFAKYGDIIRAIFSVQDITENCTLLGSLFTPGKLTCYYVDLSKLGSSITDSPVETNLWLFSMALTRDNNGVEELDNVAQLAINRTVSIDLSKIFVRYSKTIDEQTKTTVSEWSDWFEYTTKNYVDNQLKTVVSVINPSAPKIGDIKVDGSNIYIYDGTNTWQLMNAWQ